MATCPRSRRRQQGLYARAILELPERVCIEAKQPENIGNLKIEDCLLAIRNLPREQGEKILTGVMMIAYSTKAMHPLEVRWASMLASAIGLSEDDFQRCCIGARVIATMLNPSGKEGADA